MAKFRNANGDVIETQHPAVINDYRHRDDFDEISSDKSTKKTAKKVDSADAAS